MLFFNRLDCGLTELWGKLWLTLLTKNLIMHHPDREEFSMSTFDQLPETCAEKIVCCYLNATSKIQVARITNITNWYFERVVFPGQRLIFEAVPDALLEIHTGMMASSILSDTIPCQQLQISELVITVPDWVPIKPLEAVS
jgi:hypothetical protein